MLRADNFRNEAIILLIGTFDIRDLLFERWNGGEFQFGRAGEIA